MTEAVERFLSSDGARVYRMPLEVFPGFWGYAHLVIADPLVCLVDVGSGLDRSNQGLEAGLQAVRLVYGESIGWRSLTHVLVSHGHIDHFGGLRFVRGLTDAPVGVHELDWRVLACYEDRLAESVESLTRFLRQSGLEPDEQESLLAVYGVHKGLFASIPVELAFPSPCSTLGRLTIHHTPGHCPGQVVIQVDDLLLCGDQVLSDISPHQSPEQLTAYTGLGHFLDSLMIVERLAPAVRIALGGHQRPILDLAARVQAIRQLHQARLEEVLSLMARPSSLAEVARTLFPEADGFNWLLALEEAGAHVEYLLARGFLTLAPSRAGAGERLGFAYEATPDRPPPVLASLSSMCTSMDRLQLPSRAS